MFFPSSNIIYFTFYIHTDSPSYVQVSFSFAFLFSHPSALSCINKYTSEASWIATGNKTVICNIS
jgi:hypothetical protein